MENLKYPIGQFVAPEFDLQLITIWKEELRSFPSQLRESVQTLSVEQLNTPYRPEGWTVKQLVHHIADSHHHSYARFKWTMTESRPIIKDYNEKNWAELADAQADDIESSLVHLDGVHRRLVNLLDHMAEDDFRRVFIHPAEPDPVSLFENTGRYAWHGKHHLAHIQRLKDREGWS